MAQENNTTENFLVKNYPVKRKSAGYGFLRRRKFFESIEKKRTKPEKIQMRLEKFGQETTLHGVRNLTQANNWPRRIFWLVVLSVSLICLGREIDKSVREYYTYSTYAELNHHTKTPMPFPVVTICNNNMFKLDKIIPVLNGTANFYTKGLKFIRQLFPDKGLTNLDREWNQVNDSHYSSIKNMRNLVESNGHNKEDMIISCVFNRQECGPNHFEKIFTNYGLCYNFKMLPMEVNNSGPFHGLSLILNAEHLQYVAAPREKVGFRVAISTRDHAVDVTTEGLDIAVGMSTSIGIKRRCIKSLPAPYSTCVPITTDITCEPVHDVTVKHYSKSECLQTCESNYFVELCNCRVFFAFNDSVPFCSPKQYRNCYSINKDTFSRDKHRICDCPEPCDAVDFHKTISFGNFPSLSVAKTLYVTNNLEHFGKALGWKIRQFTFANSEKKKDFITESTPSFLNATFQGHYVNGNSLRKPLLKIAVDVFAFVELEITDIMFTVLDHKYNESISVNSKFYHDVKKRARDNVLDARKFLNRVIIDMISDVDFVNESGTEKYFNAFYDNLFDSIYRNLSDISEQAAIDIEDTSSDIERTTEYMRNTFGRLDVFYDDMRIELQTDKCRYSINSLLGNLGGTLGLFFGASLLAFVEAMEFWILNDSCRRKTRHSVHSV